MIIGIEGGIGTGKTLTGISYALQDLYNGKHLYSNVKIKNVPKHLENNITYITAQLIEDIFQNIKEKVWDMRNSTVFIQEMHNYMDARNSMSKKNKVLSYWILQSFPAGWPPARSHC